MRSLTDEAFLVSNPLDILRGETLYTAKLPKYEAELRELSDKALKLNLELQKYRTPGISQPKAGPIGRDLHDTIEEGRKARARVELIRSVKNKSPGVSVLRVGEHASGDFSMIDIDATIPGEQVDVYKIKEYQEEYEALKKQYEEYKASEEYNGVHPAVDKAKANLLKIEGVYLSVKSKLDAALQELEEAKDALSHASDRPGAQMILQQRVTDADEEVSAVRKELQRHGVPYRAAMKAYKDAEAKHPRPSGFELSLAGRNLAEINKAKLRAKAKLEVALNQKKHHTFDLIKFS